MKPILTALLFLQWISCYYTFCQPGNYKSWDVVEISLSASVGIKNPYIECLKDGDKAYVEAKFTGISGEANLKTYMVPGFWDGGNNWKIRFAPPCSGSWIYETVSKDRGLNKRKGKINVSEWSAKEKDLNPLRHGFICVNKTGSRPGRYFSYSDGTPFLWIADTWWDWTNRNIRFESFVKLVDTRSEQGFNIGQLFFAGNGWGQESSLLDHTFQHPDIEQIRQVEKMIAYANSKGITMWIHPWWSRENINAGIGAENFLRWWRYVIHRLHAYNVIWVLAGEYNMYNYGGFPPEFWNMIGSSVKSEDPYDRIVGAHPTPPMWEGGADAPQWSTADAIHDQPWLDYNQCQTGHARWCNELTPYIIKKAYGRIPAKPIVVTEPWYEFIEGNPSAMDIRFGAWTAILSGAAGHSYGGGHIWRAHLPERPTGIGDWPMDTSFATNTLLYPGAVSLGFMAKYLRSINWWELSPSPDLVLENPSPYCAGNPGKEYMIYLRYGGSFKFDFRSFSETDLFGYKWIDLVNNKISDEFIIHGGGIAELKCPEDFPAVVNFKDWAVHIYRVKKTGVKIENRDNSWQLHVNDSAFFIKGVVGNSYPEKIKEYGGNSVRTGWSKSELDKLGSLGLYALVNLPADAERYGMDYSDPVSVKKQQDSLLEIVKRTMDHPSVLMWAIGNELDYIPPLQPFNPKVWDAINDIAKSIHKIDPDHPVMTVIGTSMMHKVSDIVKRCPDLDLLGVNSYGDLYTLRDTLNRYGWTKPYVITEWGPSGYWEVMKTPWGAPYEQTGREKLDCYRDKYMKAIIRDRQQCLGSFVFYWKGFKQETTHTWFCMFDIHGNKSPMVELMGSMWKGKQDIPEDLPVVDSITVDRYPSRQPVYLEPGIEYTARAFCNKGDRNQFSFSWEVRPEAKYAAYAGQGEKEPKPLGGLENKKTQDIRFKAPVEKGAYRLFVYAYDDKGNFSTANSPFLVK